MPTRSKSRPPAGVIRVDFSKVKDGGRVRVPEGDYVVKVKAVKQDTSQSGNPMLVWTFTGVDGKLKGRDIIDRTTLTEKSLWKLRDLLEAMGVKVPKRVVDIPVKKLIGKELGVTLFDDEYENRISSKVGDYISPEAVGDEPDDEEDVDEPESDGLEEMDRSELKAYIKENSLDVTVRKSMSDDDIREAITEAQGEEESEDEEEEEDEDDGLDEMDRTALKSHIKSNDLDVKVRKSMSDDDIRAAIREASGEEGDEEDEDALEDIDLNDL